MQQSQFSVQHRHAEPLRGIECPISFDITENPIYLKGCQHFFDRFIIEDWFRKAFEKGDEAECPSCRHPYKITVFLKKYGDREQAIQKAFRKLFIVPIAPSAINKQISEAREFKKAAKHLRIVAQKHEALIAAQDRQIVEQTETITRQEAMLGHLASQLAKVYEEKVELEKERNNAMIAKNTIIAEKDQANEKAYKATQVALVSTAVGSVATVVCIAFAIKHQSD